MKPPVSCFLPILRWQSRNLIGVSGLVAGKLSVVNGKMLAAPPPAPTPRPRRLAVRAILTPRDSPIAARGAPAGTAPRSLLDALIFRQISGGATQWTQDAPDKSAAPAQLVGSCAMQSGY